PLMRRGQALIGFLRPFGSVELVQQIADTGVTSFAVELVPRTTRAQSMDALSSMGTICGYKAVLIAADTLPRIFPMLTTAAGTITPARVFVIGAGVAGRSEEHTSELQSPCNLVCRLLLEKKKNPPVAQGAVDLNKPGADTGLPSGRRVQGGAACAGFPARPMRAGEVGAVVGSDAPPAMAV